MVELLTRYSSELVTFLLTLLGSWFVFRFTTRQPDVVYYTSMPWKLPFAAKPLPYYGGALTVGNQGRAPAQNVRAVYPKQLLKSTQFEVTTPLPWRTEDMPDGSRAVVLESLPPKQWVTISYVTTLFSANPSYVGHEHGAARSINFMWQRVYPTWVNWTFAFLIVLGTYSAVALLVRLIAYLSGRQ